LIEVLAEGPDFRPRRGRRHPLVAILALAGTALRCGFRSSSRRVAWGRIYGPELLRALGFSRVRGPSVGTLHTVLRQIDRAALATKLGAWAATVPAATPAGSPGPAGIARDGKTRRASRKQGAPGAHPPLRWAAVRPRLGLGLAQRGGPDTPNALGGVPDVLRDVVLAGRGIPTDSLPTQRAVARTIVTAGGDLVRPVKENQPPRLGQIQDSFAHPTLWAATFHVAATVNRGHGRVERRRLVSRTALPDVTAWPGLQPVERIERTRGPTKTGVAQTEAGAGISRRAPARADAARLLASARWHWHIENRSHGLRDVTFAEDRAQVRAGRIPPIMAALRTTISGLLRVHGEPNSAAALRHFAGRPRAAMALIGLAVEN
jgi:DDE_Tnp_1-associated